MAQAEGQARCSRCTRTSRQPRARTPRVQEVTLHRQPSALGQLCTASSLGFGHFHHTDVFKQEALKEDLTGRAVRYKSSNRKTVCAWCELTPRRGPCMPGTSRRAGLFSPTVTCDLPAQGGVGLLPGTARAWLLGQAQEEHGAPGPTLLPPGHTSRHPKVTEMPAERAHVQGPAPALSTLFRRGTCRGPAPWPRPGCPRVAVAHNHVLVDGKRMTPRAANTTCPQGGCLTHWPLGGAAPRRGWRGSPPRPARSHMGQTRAEWR